MHFRCPNCNHEINVVDEASPDLTDLDVECPSCNSKFKYSDQPTKSLPQTNIDAIAHFEILDVVGEGSFGTVYKAKDTVLHRTVAIKVPRQGRIAPDSMSSFLKEARAAAGIKHPNVVQVHEIGIHDELPYIVSDLIDGVSFSSWLKTNKPNPDQCASIVKSACEALQSAHDRGIIHRDLKPGNMLLDLKGNPHITDFGLAKSDANDMTVTREGVVLGTPAYMSPEQASDSRSVTAQSDVYSMGVVLYECLTGKKPFTATDTRTVIYQVLTADPVAPRQLNKSIPRDLETICLHAMEKSPDKRYKSAGEMAMDLDRYLKGQPIHAKPVSGLQKLYRWGKRNLALSTSIIMLAIFSGIILTLALGNGPSNDGTVRASISCSLPAETDSSLAKLEWVFLPLGPGRIPNRDKAIRPRENKMTVDVKLLPGEYLVSVHAIGIGFHEVYRLVPESPKQGSGNYSCNSFKYDNDKVLLPKITILPNETVTNDLAFVEGGEYLAGKEGNVFSPPTKFEIKDFYIERTEVTFDRYTASMSLPVIYSNDASLPKGNFPIVGVTWYQAAHFAEQNGLRLLNEIEWEYAATNRGTTSVPWEGDHQAEPRWQLNPVGMPAFDITPGTRISGMFTNASEITSSALHPFGDGKMPASSSALTVNGFVYRGGPSDIPTENQHSIADRRSIQNRNQTGNFLSFRCGMSATPRYLD